MILGVEPDGLVEVGERLFVVLLLKPDPAAIAKCQHIFWVELDRLFIVGYALLYSFFIAQAIPLSL